MGARLLENRSSRATFLCYHSIAAQGPRYLTISSELFERQLAQLCRRKLRGGDLQTLAALAEGRRPDPAVFLTFDDGFRDNHETALPLLRAYGFSAFIFVLPHLVDTGGPFRWPEVALDYGRYGATMRSVTWSMLEEMKEGGFEVGSHGLTHGHLSQLAPEVLRQELWDSRARIIERLGACDTLAYPFGELSELVETAARECGYKFAFTLPTRAGQRGATPHSIPRINVDYRDEGMRFLIKLAPMGKRVLLSPGVASARRAVRHMWNGSAVQEAD